ncbi:MAG: hypothetical protein GY814_03505 [Gammaproteobacteria bacterium]|nr:hypothetical protein [Gammaproteobacteria bacterium]
MSSPAKQHSFLPDGLRKILLWSHKNDRRWPRYFFTITLVMGVIWGIAISYILLAQPTYTSKWTLILPGKGAGSNINLNDIGQASTMAASPYSNSVTNPKSNYKEFIKSDLVIRMAANKQGLTPRELGAPRVKLVDQTSLIYLSITGNSPEQAQSKAVALHESFSELLDRLRGDELKQQELGGNNVLNSFQKKLQQASSNLLNYQSKSNIVSMQQFEQLVLTVEKFRREQVQTRAELKQVQGHSKRLIQNLGITPQQAGDALVLQNDRQFTSAFKEFTEAQRMLNTNSSKWDRNHPEVRKERARNRAAKNAMNQRIKILLKGRNKNLIELLSLDGDNTRNILLQNLITLDAKRSGLQRKLDEISVLITELESERNLLTGPAAMLDDLKRNHQVAEAVFMSALARTDTKKSDIYVSYPLVQMLEKPTLPTEVTSPNKILAVAGALLGSIFALTGLILMWIRKPFLRKILKSE